MPGRPAHILIKIRIAEVLFSLPAAVHIKKGFNMYSAGRESLKIAVTICYTQNTFVSTSQAYFYPMFMVFYSKGYFLTMTFLYPSQKHSIKLTLIFKCCIIYFDRFIRAIRLCSWPKFSCGILAVLIKNHV